MALGQNRAWTTPGLALTTDHGRGAIRAAVVVQSVEPELRAKEGPCEIAAV